LCLKSIPSSLVGIGADVIGIEYAAVRRVCGEVNPVDQV
jgi:pyruvate/2-oxoglutarate dehydrogenase complex dihydrolipoamide dehydrogenase (E3) component